MNQGQAKDLTCPSCGRLLYDRKLETCGYCGARLPPNVRIPGDAVARMAADDRKRKREKERWADFDNRPLSSGEIE